ncbi:DUF5000 domain-containing lipoprotein [Niabella drilacis]|uniref:F5/8 type C domain-containing protein n=1 Tax=Niabella drilacis (strain DSM 25811 / CCM 8410 / CCUG 62505 / LMG 26954 / E90) TaxID=1285928 RepID=A0A1G6RL95_NIADE|nr:DUF5000 domain-containing lipoprotein [Niabella drilacis]SDD05201.1 protein of unknown function [Niabella drilacis]
MKKIINTRWLAAAALLLVIAGCKRDVINRPLDGSAEKPATVTVSSVTNANGQATITYSFPAGNQQSAGIQYVVAEYEPVAGRPREVKASRYGNTLVVDGFNDTLAHVIKLYAVSPAEVKSDPVSVTVNPAPSPLQLAYRSLKSVATFGGINAQCQNALRANLAIVLLADTANNGKWTIVNTAYANDSLINSNFRGMDTIRRKFGLYIRDQYQNYSDTLVATIKPLFERLLDKTKWAHLNLPGECKLGYTDQGVDWRLLWDTPGPSHKGWPTFFTDETATTPQTVTIDFGMPAVWSRVNFCGRNTPYYAWRNPRDIEIWASNNPNPDGSYDASWTKVLTCHVIKPSGLPYGQESGADVAAAVAGWEFQFPIGQPAYRYFRLRTIRNWIESTPLTLDQLTLWGSY